MTRKKVTIHDLLKKKKEGRPISVLTAYDYPSATLVDQAGVDVILVGDSLAMVVLGLESTVGVTMDEMLHHCRAVARGASGAFLVGDMPFMSYQASVSEAVRNAGRFLQEAQMDSIKLEGGQAVVPAVRAIVDAGIAVMGHIGLTPQSISRLGGYRVQGKTADDAIRLLDDALALEEAGAFSVVLEAVPAPVAEAISQRLQIPTIGIGAGVGCDGQVLVYHDMLGMFDRFTPRFVRQYARLNESVVQAVAAYRDDVEKRHFPTEEHTYAMEQSELEKFQERLATYSRQDG